MIKNKKTSKVIKTIGTISVVSMGVSSSIFLDAVQTKQFLSRKQKFDILKKYLEQKKIFNKKTDVNSLLAKNISKDGTMTPHLKNLMQKALKEKQERKRILNASQYSLNSGISPVSTDEVITKDNLYSLGKIKTIKFSIPFKSLNNSDLKLELNSLNVINNLNQIVGFKFNGLYANGIKITDKYNHSIDSKNMIQTGQMGTWDIDANLDSIQKTRAYTRKDLRHHEVIKKVEVELELPTAQYIKDIRFLMQKDSLTNVKKVFVKTNDDVSYQLKGNNSYKTVKSLFLAQDSFSVSKGDLTWENITSSGNIFLDNSTNVPDGMVRVYEQNGIWKPFFKVSQSSVDKIKVALLPEEKLTNYKDTDLKSVTTSTSIITPNATEINFWDAINKFKTKILGNDGKTSLTIEDNRLNAYAEIFSNTTGRSCIKKLSELNSLNSFDEIKLHVFPKKGFYFNNFRNSFIKKIKLKKLDKSFDSEKINMDIISQFDSNLTTTNNLKDLGDISEITIKNIGDQPITKLSNIRIYDLNGLKIPFRIKNIHGLSKTYQIKNISDNSVSKTSSNLSDASYILQSFSRTKYIEIKKEHKDSHDLGISIVLTRNTKISNIQIFRDSTLPIDIKIKNVENTEFHTNAFYINKNKEWKIDNIPNILSSNKLKKLHSFSNKLEWNEEKNKQFFGNSNIVWKLYNDKDISEYDGALSNFGKITDIWLKIFGSTSGRKNMMINEIRYFKPGLLPTDSFKKARDHYEIHKNDRSKYFPIQSWTAMSEVLTPYRESYENLTNARLSLYNDNTHYREKSFMEVWSVQDSTFPVITSHISVFDDQMNPGREIGNIRFSDSFGADALNGRSIIPIVRNTKGDIFQLMPNQKWQYDRNYQNWNDSGVGQHFLNTTKKYKWRKLFNSPTTLSTKRNVWTGDYSKNKNNGEELEWEFRFEGEIFWHQLKNYVFNNFSKKIFLRGVRKKILISKVLWEGKMPHGTQNKKFSAKAFTIGKFQSYKLTFEDGTSVIAHSMHAYHSKQKNYQLIHFSGDFWNQKEGIWVNVTKGSSNTTSFEIHNNDSKYNKTITKIERMYGEDYQNGIYERIFDNKSKYTPEYAFTFSRGKVNKQKEVVDAEKIVDLKTIFYSGINGEGILNGFENISSKYNIAYEVKSLGITRTYTNTPMDLTNGDEIIVKITPKIGSDISFTKNGIPVQEISVKLDTVSNLSKAKVISPVSILDSEFEILGSNYHGHFNLGLINKLINDNYTIHTFITRAGVRTEYLLNQLPSSFMNGDKIEIIAKANSGIKFNVSGSLVSQYVIKRIEKVKGLSASIPITKQKFMPSFIGSTGNSSFSKDTINSLKNIQKNSNIKLLIQKQNHEVIDISNEKEWNYSHFEIGDIITITTNAKEGKYFSSQKDPLSTTEIFEIEKTDIGTIKKIRKISTIIKDPILLGVNNSASFSFENEWIPLLFQKGVDFVFHIGNKTLSHNTLPNNLANGQKISIELRITDTSKYHWEDLSLTSYTIVFSENISGLNQNQNIDDIHTYVYKTIRNGEQNIVLGPDGNIKFKPTIHPSTGDNLFIPKNIHSAKMEKEVYGKLFGANRIKSNVSTFKFLKEGEKYKVWFSDGSFKVATVIKESNYFIAKFSKNVWISTKDNGTIKNQSPNIYKNQSILKIAKIVSPYQTLWTGKIDNRQQMFLPFVKKLKIGDRYSITLLDGSVINGVAVSRKNGKIFDIVIVFSGPNSSDLNSSTYISNHNHKDGKIFIQHNSNIWGTNPIVKIDKILSFYNMDNKFSKLKNGDKVAYLVVPKGNKTVNENKWILQINSVEKILKKVSKAGVPTSKGISILGYENNGYLDLTSWNLKNLNISISYNGKTYTNLEDSELKKLSNGDTLVFTITPKLGFAFFDNVDKLPLKDQKIKLTKTIKNLQSTVKEIEKKDVDENFVDKDKIIRKIKENLSFNYFTKNMQIHLNKKEIIYDRMHFTKNSTRWSKYDFLRFGIFYKSPQGGKNRIQLLDNLDSYLENVEIGGEIHVVALPIQGYRFKDVKGEPFLDIFKIKLDATMVPTILARESMFNTQSVFFSGVNNHGFIDPDSNVGTIIKDSRVKSKYMVLHSQNEYNQLFNAKGILKDTIAKDNTRWTDVEPKNLKNGDFVIVYVTVAANTKNIFMIGKKNPADDYVIFHGKVSGFINSIQAPDQSRLTLHPSGITLINSGVDKTVNYRDQIVAKISKEFLDEINRVLKNNESNKIKIWLKVTNPNRKTPGEQELHINKGSDGKISSVSLSKNIADVADIDDVYRIRISLDEGYLFNISNDILHPKLVSEITFKSLKVADTSINNLSITPISQVNNKDLSKLKIRLQTAFIKNQEFNIEGLKKLFLKLKYRNDIEVDLILKNKNNILKWSKNNILDNLNIDANDDGDVTLRYISIINSIANANNTLEQGDKMFIKFRFKNSINGSKIFTYYDGVHNANHVNSFEYQVKIIDTNYKETQELPQLLKELKRPQLPSNLIFTDQNNKLSGQGVVDWVKTHIWKNSYINQTLEYIIWKPGDRTPNEQSKWQNFSQIDKNRRWTNGEILYFKINSNLGYGYSSTTQPFINSFNWQIRITSLKKAIHVPNIDFAFPKNAFSSFASYKQMASKKINPFWEFTNNLGQDLDKINITWTIKHADGTEEIFTNNTFYFQKLVNGDQIKWNISLKTQYVKGSDKYVIYTLDEHKVFHIIQQNSITSNWINVPLSDKVIPTITKQNLKEIKFEFVSAKTSTQSSYYKIIRNPFKSILKLSIDEKERLDIWINYTDYKGHKQRIQVFANTDSFKNIKISTNNSNISFEFFTKTGNTFALSETFLTNKIEVSINAKEQMVKTNIVTLDKLPSKIGFIGVNNHGSIKNTDIVVLKKIIENANRNNLLTEIIFNRVTGPSSNIEKKFNNFIDFINYITTKKLKNDDSIKIAISIGADMSKGIKVEGISLNYMEMKYKVSDLKNLLDITSANVKLEYSGINGINNGIITIKDLNPKIYLDKFFIKVYKERMINGRIKRIQISSSFDKNGNLIISRLQNGEGIIIELVAKTDYVFGTPNSILQKIERKFTIHGLRIPIICPDMEENLSFYKDNEGKITSLSIKNTNNLNVVYTASFIDGVMNFNNLKDLIKELNKPKRISELQSIHYKYVLDKTSQKTMALVDENNKIFSNYESKISPEYIFKSVNNVMFPTKKQLEKTNALTLDVTNSRGVLHLGDIFGKGKAKSTIPYSVEIQKKLINTDAWKMDRILQFNQLKGNLVLPFGYKYKFIIHYSENEHNKIYVVNLPLDNVAFTLDWTKKIDMIDKPIFISNLSLEGDKTLSRVLNKNFFVGVEKNHIKNIIFELNGKAITDIYKQRKFKNGDKITVKLFLKKDAIFQKGLNRDIVKTYAISGLKDNLEEVKRKKLSLATVGVILSILSTFGIALIFKLMKNKRKRRK